VSEDWRLKIDMLESGVAHAVTERLQASELEHDLDSAFADRVVISRDGGELFCYTDSREQAERVAELIAKLAAEHGWHLATELRRWHPTAEQWEDPDKPLPVGDAELEAEHEELIEDEDQESSARGYPEYEVKIDCTSRHEAKQLAKKLRGEGIPTVVRWRYVLVGALDEDSADAIAERLRNEAPPGCTVTAEGTLQAVYDDQPPNPFAFFGGLAG
jgi:hypothetical protein